MSERGIAEAYLDIQKTRISMQLRIQKNEELGVSVEALKKIFEQIETAENVAEDTLRSFAEDHPIWRSYFSKVKGMGLTLGGILLTRLDPTKFDTVSKLWKYCGLGVTEGKADKMMRNTKGGFSPFLKGVILGRIAKSLVMAKGIWYQEYKCCKKVYGERADLKAELEKKTKGAKLHIDLMAKRKMIKSFLACYWHVYRQHYGYETNPEKVRQATHLNPYLMIDR